MENKNWIETPTKKQTIIFGLTGIIGTILLIISMTNCLTESPFKGEYFVFFFLLVITVLTTTRLIRNYFKQTKKQIE